MSALKKNFHQKLFNASCIYMKVLIPPTEYNNFSVTYTNIDQFPKTKIIKSANYSTMKLHTMRLITYLKEWSVQWHYFLLRIIATSSKQNSTFISLREVTFLERRVKCRKEYQHVKGCLRKGERLLSWTTTPFQLHLSAGILVIYAFFSVWVLWLLCFAPRIKCRNY